jgi:hypothetical protein
MMNGFSDYLVPLPGARAPDHPAAAAVAPRSRELFGLIAIRRSNPETAH